MRIKLGVLWAAIIVILSPKSSAEAEIFTFGDVHYVYGESVLPIEKTLTISLRGEMIDPDTLRVIADPEPIVAVFGIYAKAADGTYVPFPNQENPLKPFQITVTDTPISITLPLSVDLYLKQETIPEGYNACFAEDYYHPILLPDHITLIGRRAGMQGLRVTVMQGDTELAPASNVSIEVIGSEKTYSIETNAEGIATLFPIPDGEYVIKQPAAQKGFSVSQPEIDAALARDEILYLDIVNEANGFLTVSPMGETLGEALLSEKIPLERAYEVFDQAGQSFGIVEAGSEIELPASVEGILYLLCAADAETNDGFPVDSEVHEVLLYSGRQAAYEPVVQTNQGVFHLSHVSAEDGSKVPGGTFTLSREDGSDVLVFQADENGQYAQRTPIDAGQYTLRMAYAAEGFQYAEHAYPVEIKPYFHENQHITDVQWESMPATKAYLGAPTIVSDTQSFQSLFETDAEIDFKLRALDQENLSPNITDINILMDAPDIRGVQIVEMRRDGADLLAKRRLGIQETEEFLELNISGVVQYTANYPVSPDETASIQLESPFAVTVATFEKVAERPQYALYGRILDQNGDPVEGFRVSRQDPTGKLLYEQTITDAFGAYAFFATSSDAYVVYHPEPGYGVFEYENGGDAILLPLQMLQGRVVDHGVLGDSMITLQMGADEILPDVDGAFSYSGAFSTGDQLVANVPDQAIAVFEEKEDEILVHVYPVSTIMGAVVDEDGGLVVEGAQVTLIGNDGVTEMETSTDSSGAFAFDHLLPGQYTVSFASPEGYLLKDEQSMDVSISAGEKRMLKRIQVIRPAMITGSVLSEDGTPLEDVEIILQPTGSVAKTSPDGTFSFDGLYVDTYRLETALTDGYVLWETPEPILLSYAGEQAEVTVRATQSAAISGVILDDSGISDTQKEAIGLQNATVTLLTEQGDAVASVQTASDGKFSFDALRPGAYRVSVELPSGMIFSTRDNTLIQGVNDTIGTSGLVSLQAGEERKDLHCGAVASGMLSGRVWMDVNRDGLFTGSEPMVPNTVVTLSQLDGAQASVTTEDGGTFAFSNLRAGDYELSFHLPEDYSFSDTINWSDWSASKPSVDSQSASISISISAEDAAPVIDISALRGAAIRARIWADADLDGTDRGERGVGDLPVRLFSFSGDDRVLVAELATDQDGYALFDHVLPGDYALEYRLTDESWGFVSGAEKTLQNNWASGPKITVSSDQSTWQTGVGVAKLAAISGVAFTDANYDGLRGEEEAGLSTKVALYNDQNEIVATTATNRTDGAFSFEGILPGRYAVEFSLNKGYRFTRNRPDAPSFNSNVPEQAGLVGKTASFFLPMGETALIDAGAYPASSISGAVWEDLNNSGQYAPGNPPIAGLNITLVSDEQDVAQTVTDQNGQYKFEQLPPGTYLVRVELPDGIRFSTQTFTTGHANNIQQTEITLGKTPKFYLPMGVDKTNVDAGAIYPGTLSGFALSQDGEGVAGVKISVLRDTDVYAEAVTDANGSYLFENMRSGKITLRFELPEGWLFSEDQTGEIASVIPQGKRAENVNITICKETVITGSIWLDENASGARDQGEKPLVGAVVALQQHESLAHEEGTILSITGTNVDGYYRFEGLQPGFYSIRIVPPEYTYLYDENALQSKIYSLTESDTIVHDAPAYMAGYIRGKVYEDHDNDGKFSDGDLPMMDIPLEMRNESGEVVKEAISDSDGNYLFNELQPGRYTVHVAVPSGYMLVAPSDDDPVFDTDGTTPAFDFSMGDMKNNMDAALLRPSAIGDLVWLDANGNGLQETGEPGVAGISVTLYKMEHGNLQQMAQTQTDEKGRYRFNKLIPGKYQLAFAVGDYLPTKPNDSLPEINSKLPWVSKPNLTTEAFSVYSGVNELRMDAGLITRNMAEAMKIEVSEDGRISSP